MKILNDMYIFSWDVMTKINKNTHAVSGSECSCMITHSVFPMPDLNWSLELGSFVFQEKNGREYISPL